MGVGGAACERWHQILLYAVQNMTNAFLWIAFASIDQETAHYYEVSTTWVNMLSTSFLILYVPGTVLCAVLLSQQGLRRALVVGTALDSAGALLRAASTALVASGQHAAGYAVLLTGQCLAGLAQPIFVNTAAKVAADWFPAADREMATTVAVMANPIGNGLAQLVPTFFVSSDADAAAGMPRLLWAQAGWCTLGFLWTAAAFRDRPAEAPSESALARQRAADAQRGGGTRAALLELWGEYRTLLRNRDFLVLLVGFGYGLGIFNALLTVLEQFVRPAGYSSDDAGAFGGALLGAGLVGAGVMGALLDATHRYKELLRAGFLGGSVATVLIVLLLRPGHYGQAMLAFALGGFFFLPMLPVSIECAVECTYPVSEAASSSLLIIVGNWAGIACIAVLQDLTALRTGYHGAFSPAAVALLVSVAFCGLVVLLFNGEYRRQAMEGDLQGGGGGYAALPSGVGGASGASGASRASA